MIIIFFFLSPESSTDNLIFVFCAVIETKEGNTLTIHAEIVPDPDESRLLKREPNGACPLCSLGLKITHTVNCQLPWMHFFFFFWVFPYNINVRSRRTWICIFFQDVLILSQFLRSDGCVLPRRITGLCSVQQKRLGPLVAMAQKAGSFGFLLLRPKSEQQNWNYFLLLNIYILQIHWKKNWSNNLKSGCNLSSQEERNTVLNLCSENNFQTCFRTHAKHQPCLEPQRSEEEVSLESVQRVLRWKNYKGKIQERHLAGIINCKKAERKYTP